MKWLLDCINESLSLACSIMILAILGSIGYELFKKLESRRKSTMSSFNLYVNDTSFDIKDYLDIKGFDSLVGLTEVKEQLKLFVDIFNNRDIYKEKGLEVPKGLILYGPPGCGKTALAKAIACEANVNFLCRNASDLINSTSAIATLFSEARKNAPCIIFIDELDIIGSRFSMMGVMAGEHQIQVTQLLAEMDGFQKNEDILVIGATNDISKLDPALLRSGRFSKKYSVMPPVTKDDVLGLVEMYKGDVDFDEDFTDIKLTMLLKGFSPADIKSILNECGIIATNRGTPITMQDVTRALIELQLSSALSHVNLSSERSRVIAYHEVGHAVVAWALGQYVQTISVLGNNRDTGGLTVTQDPFEEDCSKVAVLRATPLDDLISVIICYGGLMSEYNFIYNSNKLRVTRGASQDLQCASETVTTLLTHFDFTKEGFFALSGFNTATQLRKAPDLDLIKSICAKCENIASDILLQNKDLVDKLVGLVLESGMLTYDTTREYQSEVKPYELSDSIDYWLS